MSYLPGQTRPRYYYRTKAELRRTIKAARRQQRHQDTNVRALVARIAELEAQLEDLGRALAGGQ